MMRILVVEDEKLLCDGIAEDLELEKYTVERCYDGAEAYDLLLSESFDLLILDLNLPGMDGLDLLRAVRAEQPELRVLILSARAELSDRVAGLDLGATISRNPLPWRNWRPESAACCAGSLSPEIRYLLWVVSCWTYPPVLSPPEKGRWS